MTFQMEKDFRKNKDKKCRAACAAPAAALLLLLIILSGCSGGGDGRELHTMVAGEGTRTPETVIVTVPGETVIVTVYVSGGPGTSSPATPGVTSPEDTGGESGTSADTAAPEYTWKTVTATKDLGSGSRALFIYPEVEGMASANIQSKLNTLMAQIAEYDFTANESCKDYADRIAAGSKVNYETKSCDVTYAGNGIMSVRTAAEYTVSGADPVLLAFVHILNTSTGKEIKPKDLYSDFGGLLDLLASGGMTKIYATEGYDSAADLDGTVVQYRARMAYGVYPPVYFTADSAVLIMALEQQKSGYAEYSAPLRQAGKFFKIAPSD